MTWLASAGTTERHRVQGIILVTNSNNNKKTVGVWICSALVIGNMVGSGIFLLPSSLAQYGGIGIIGWLATTFGALMTALVFVRLSRRFPRQGGPYRYAFENFGSFAGFSVAWSYWVSIWCGNAAISIAAVTYLSYFWPSLQENSTYAVAVALAFVWMTTLLNLKGIKEAGIFQLITTIIKFLPLAAIGISSLFVFDIESFKPFNLSGEPIIHSVTATAALTLWAFLGLESATIPADNVSNPDKTIPKATLIGFLATAVVYISSMVAIMSLLPSDSLAKSGAPFADAASVMWGDWAGSAIAVVAVISCLGALNGWTLLQGQVPMSAARDGLLPKILSDQDNSGVSSGALVISSILISVLVIANFSEGMVSLFTFSILVSTLGIFIPYLLSIAADLRFIVSGWNKKSDYFSLLTAIFALGYCIWAISGIGSKAMLWGVGLIVAGSPIYLIMKIKLNAKSKL